MSIEKLPIVTAARPTDTPRPGFDSAARPRNGMFHQFSQAYETISAAWEPLDHELSAESGSRQIFAEAMEVVTDKVSQIIHPALNSVAVHSGASVTAYYAHTMAALAQANNLSKSEYRTRLTDPGTVGVLTWVSGIRRSLSTTVEDMIGMRDNDNFGGTNKKLAHHMLTERGFALRSPQETLFDALQNNPFFDTANGLFSEKCIATKTGMIGSLLVAVANLTVRDERLLGAMLDEDS